MVKNLIEQHSFAYFIVRDIYPSHIVFGDAAVWSGAVHYEHFREVRSLCAIVNPSCIWVLCLGLQRRTGRDGGQKSRLAHEVDQQQLDTVFKVSILPLLSRNKLRPVENTSLTPIQNQFVAHLEDPKNWKGSA